MRKKLTMVTMLFLVWTGWGETMLSTASSASVPADTTFVDGSSVSSSMKIDYGPFEWDRECRVTLNGSELLSSNSRGLFTWQPQKTGANTLVWSSANVAITSKVNVASLTFAVAPTPNPPMSKVSSISITPVTRNFPVGGGGNAIITSGSGTWTAAVSELWLTLSATSGSVGTPVAYTVSASTNIGQRVGYVYVAGHTHTVTQDGYAADVSPTEITVEKGGKTGTITLDSPGRYSWDARPNNDWISITPTHGVGSATLTYQVAPYAEVSTRSGSITVGDKTVTVFQYGSRMKLNKYTEMCDYFTHVIPITVNALAVTSWNVKPNASWISVVDAGNGKGGDTVSIAVGENPSWKARTGTVTIGTETFTVTQEGRTALSFSINPTTATASVTGGNGVLVVNATPDLPWTAKSGANWLTIVSGYTSGAGNGNVVYNASPNSTLSQRTGKITITPGDSLLNAKTLTVTQPAAVAAISKTAHEFAADGGSVAVEVTVDGIVEWTVSESISWLSVEGSTSRVGPGTVVLSAAANGTIYPRSGTLTIAGKTFSVSQQARGVELEYESKVFGTDGGMESISIHPDGNVSWTAVASDNWIVVFQNESGTGDAEIIYILAPYEGDGSPRTGWITIGDKKVYITQRAYDVDITPRAEYVTGNSGAGEIGVSAGIGDVWQAIIEAPWIKIVTGYDAGTGNGTVRFTYTENNTGLTRTGKIVIAGEVYTLTQAARIPISIAADVEGHGTVSGAGEYALGDKVSLTATPDEGYEFLYWTGDCGESMQNPLPVTADVAKRVMAHFGPLTPEFTKTEVSTDGVTLTWSGLAWATKYKIYRAPTDVFPSVALVTLDASKGTTWLDTTGDVGKTYFYWVEAIGADDTTECKDATSGAKQKPIVYSSITYTNLKGATHENPATYQEGTVVSFVAPSAVTGYTFTGWTPSAISATMTGPQAVRANWKANTYTIAYNPNGGSGAMAGTAATYDQDVTLADSTFLRTGFEFTGWATNETGAVAYAAGETVRNLSALQGGVVTLYAVWKESAPVGPTYEPPAWEQVNKEDTMIVYATVYDVSTKTFIEADGAKLGAFDRNGECRGVSEIMDGPMGRLFQLSVGVESETEKGIVLMVWNPMTGEIVEIGQTVDCNPDKQIGQIFEPIRFDTGALELEVSVKEGWNWIATGLVPADGKVGSVLAGLTFANNDVIKGVKNTATYYNGAWYPASFVIEPGKAYMLKKSAGGEESLVVSGAAMANGVDVVAGWNWIGSTLTVQTSVNALSHSEGFANNDVIKSVKGSATYYNGKWYPDTFTLDPGGGYKLKVSKAGTVNVTESKAKILKAAGFFRFAPLSNVSAPTYDPVAQEDTMIVYSTVLNEDGNAIETPGSLLVAFAADGECRGVTEIMEGPLGNLYQLSVGVASATEKGFVLKVWDAARGELLDVRETIDSNEEKQQGMIFEPIAFHVKAGALPPEPEPVEPPVYDPVAQEDTMIVYASVLDSEGAAIEADGSLLVAFAADGECRGVTEIMEGPLGNLYQLSVGVASATEKGFVLKVWDAARGELLDVRETIDSNEEKQQGMIFEPIVLHVVANEPPAPAVTETQTTDVPVPFEWLKEKYPGLGTVEDYEARANATAANGRPVWACYVAGEDPTDAKSQLQVNIKIVDGKPVISWTPDMSAAEPKRHYTLMGKTNLNDAAWVIPMNDAHRFYKVQVTIGEPGLATEVAAKASADGVALSWRAVDLAIGYNIYRATVDDFTCATLIASVSETAYVDVTAAHGVEYHYWIVSVANGGEWRTSEMVTGHRGLQAPQNVRALSSSSWSTRTLTWDAVEGADSYRIMRALSGSFDDAVAIGECSDTVFGTGWGDTCDCWYWVVATNAASESEKSASLMVHYYDPYHPGEMF